MGVLLTNQHGLNDVSINTCKSGPVQPHVSVGSAGRGHLATVHPPSSMEFPILVFQLPNIWFHFLLLRFILAVIHLLDDQVGRAVLHDLHVGPVVVPVVPPGILVPILWELQRRLSLQVNADAVDARLGQALVAQSVAPRALLHHLARQLGDVALALPADGLARLVDLGKSEGMDL